MDASITLAVLVTLIFARPGTAKIMARQPMRELASEAGFSVDAHGRIGVLDVAGALITHLRRGHGPRKYAPAVGCGVLVDGYLAALIGAIA
jgi:hypothetical protein